MPSRPLFPAVFGLALGLCLPGHAQSAAQWQAEQVAASQKSEQVMLEANKHRSLLAQYQVMRHPYAINPDAAFRIIFGQYLSWYQSFIGDYPDAAASFSIKQPALPDDRPSPLDNPDYRARPALEAIPELASNYRAVFFNEAHNIPLTRTLTVQLLGKLRAEGFDYFAAETLYQTDTGLQARGYPVAGSGFYTQEPICAEMVRTALKLGFKVVAYEALSDVGGDAREFAKHEQYAERRRDDGVGGAVGQRFEHGARQQIADKQGIGEGQRDAEGDGDRQRQPQHLPAKDGGQDHRLPGKGEDCAMREVGAVEHPIGQRVAAGEQGIERAGMHAVQNLLQEIEHGRSAGADRSALPSGLHRRI